MDINVVSPMVAIIILTWNNYDDTRECIKSVLSINYDNFKVIVVDNNSTDGSVERLMEEFNQCVFLKNDINLGYAGGNNIGLKYALERNFKYIWILNNDVRVSKNVLKEMISIAKEYNTAGIIGSKIYLYSKPYILSFAGGKVNEWSGVTKHIGFGERDTGQYDSIREVDFITGCNILFKRECIEDIGLFDENYFLYYEDTDISVRAKRAGWQVLFVPAVGIWHKVYTSLENPALSSSYYFTRNRLYFMKKFYPLRLPIAFIISLRYSLLNHILKRRWQCLVMSLKGYLDFLLKRMGSG